MEWVVAILMIPVTIWVLAACLSAIVGDAKDIFGGGR